MNTGFSSIKRLHFFIILIALAAGCCLAGCEKTNKQTLTSQQAVKKYDQTTRLEGLVTRNKPIKIGVIKVTDSNGRLVADTLLQDSNHYQIDIPANTELPIILTFYPNPNPNPNSADTDQLVAAVVDPTITKYDINPLTTAIAKKAASLGGYTRANMVTAAQNTVAVPDANKTSTGFRGDPTTQYGGWH
jgi:hypothetical protein